MRTTTHASRAPTMAHAVKKHEDVCVRSPVDNDLPKMRLITCCWAVDHVLSMQKSNNRKYIADPLRTPFPNRHGQHKTNCVTSISTGEKPMLRLHMQLASHVGCS